MGFAEFPCVMPTIHPNILWTAKTTKVYKPTSCKILGGFTYGKLLGPFCSNCFNLQTRKPGANTRCHRAMAITSVQWLCRAAPFWSVNGYCSSSILASHVWITCFGMVGGTWGWAFISMTRYQFVKLLMPQRMHSMYYPYYSIFFPLTLTICTNSLNNLDCSQRY